MRSMCPCDLGVREGARLVRTDGEMKVYAFDEHPGFYYVSNALSSEEQRVWVRAAATDSASLRRGQNSGKSTEICRWDCGTRLYKI